MTKNKISGSRNRRVGHSWERLTAEFLNAYSFLPLIGTARRLSRFYDDNKVDIVTEDINKMEEFGLAIQNKSSTVTQQYPKILSEIRTNIKEKLKINLKPVIFHQQTKRSGSRFFKLDDFACLYLQDFLEIYTDMQRYKKGFELLNPYFDSIQDEDKEEIHKQLTKLGL